MAPPDRPRSRSRRRRGALALGALVAGATTAAVPASPAAAQPPALPAPDAHGIDVEGDELTPVAGHTRLYEATMRTGAIFQPRGTPSIDPVTVPVNVRIRLPQGYSATGDPYPVLFLLHGGAATWRQWSEEGDLDTALQDRSTSDPDDEHDVIVVMPEGGQAGWYTDWYGRTDGEFAPAWETFHMDQLVPWIDTNLNTTGDAAGRSIAGLSMGGLGSLMYAGRHTGLFSAVGSFSGGTTLRAPQDPDDPDPQETVSTSMWAAGAAIDTTGLLDGTFRVNLPLWPPPSEAEQRAYRMETVFGPESTWDQQSPLQMADRYATFDHVALYSGTAEPDIHHWNELLHDELPVAPRYCVTGGDHSMTWWQTYLEDFVDQVHGDAGSGADCPS